MKTEEYQDVEYILLDPSCSGSGIVRRLDHLLAQQDEEAEQTTERLEALSAFQKKAILHAFSFPSVKRVVYSTCSVHVQENEEVVNHVLQENKGFKLIDMFPGWKRRGLPEQQNASKMVRTLPEEDYTIGFFVALFERK